MKYDFQTQEKSTDGLDIEYQVPEPVLYHNKDSKKPYSKVLLLKLFGCIALQNLGQISTCI